ncbi:NAD-glutamate dehydrogenase [Mangrovibrevibacter kandeliae]|uniref:NAD-glutamate dehydrogenase n=1 Tax=Mangrovibrevibacter kandeliae TaxID=2968473 RepID=UPI00211969FC|nr:NAD-glutamate dehydrogenase [Aurantimonas sp. CSK15Z-1]MCQ8783569.1 NAD-glutamate dehydrogenase [Aurantimonas sp. CSK15Z-1]
MDADVSSKKPIIRAVVAELGDGAAAALAPLLLARPPADDLDAFEPAALTAAIRRGVAALEEHKSGEPLVRVEQPEGFTLDGAPLTLVSVVNDDMPFLFDSVMGEIAETAATIRFISHPILDVTRDAAGALDGFAATTTPGGRGGERLSLIQVALDRPANAGASLEARLLTVLTQVVRANLDFDAMRSRVGEAVEGLRRYAAEAEDVEGVVAVGEAAQFVEWLRDENFTFLGCREFDYAGPDADEVLVPREEVGLGILRDPDMRILRRAGQATTTTPELRAFLEGPDPLIVTKANTRSVVHRRAYMDYIGIKRYEDGRFVGELRIVGLFTSTAYTRSILAIPYLRLKAETVIGRFDLRPGSHSAKALLNALESYPRDELFQIDVDTLEGFIGTVMELGERPRVRVLPRIDRFDRFVSVLVFVPRERYDSRLRERIGLLLAERYDGHVSAYYPAFPEGLLTRVHFIIGRTEGKTPEVDARALEARIAAMARNWEDAYGAAATQTPELMRYAPGMPEGYRDAVDPREAVADAGAMARLGDDRRLIADFYRRPGDADTLLRLKLFHLGPAVALSTRVPILENMGFDVLFERTHRLTRPDGTTVHIHDMDLADRKGAAIPLADEGAALESTFGAVCAGLIESDGFNALTLEAGLDHRQANVLRAYAMYLRQTGLAYSPDYFAAVMARQPAIARLLWQLFDDSFNPRKADRRDLPEAGSTDSFEPEDRQRRAAAERGSLETLQAILSALDAVESLDDDRILRRYLAVILATLRTNYYAVPTLSAAPRSTPDEVHPALAFKLDSARVEGLPEPVPFREIFVFDARVEGVHLRFGTVARGGLRWSDRAQDYRTEVLGLVKAQQVKNAVIVPVGAKGGFYPKRLPPAAADRDAWFEAGRSAYIVFVASLLSITDTLAGDSVVTPADVVRFDGEDPYFVVAADKGTATFSDTANAIAQAEGFWLDDAFASGGSAGYDHKAMGITARGAWEAVKRHFREIDHDIQAVPFTTVGCGDMSGDVFGNGMLLSQETRLVAAFDHRDIFIDPNPDTAASFAERKRLFDLPRSSWADYDRAKISAGGGVFSRREKLIRLSPEAAAAIGWDRTSGTPAEIISAILKAPVDLLWFGGIGTYVRASSEQNAEVGDRANDALRITGAQVRAKVVGEGANLGVTQKGRIEYARAGGRINSDAIDNSAGVNTSDVEVNIKIALKGAMQDDRLTRPDRNVLLASMTAEVADLVLANNYEQTLALSLDTAEGPAALPLQARFMATLEARGILNREVETLPGEAALTALRGAGNGLTRPENGVLLAYSKITLFDEILASGLPDDPYFAGRLFGYFPSAMREAFAVDIERHRLHREIVSTVLANEAVNHLGATFATAVRDATGASAGEVVQAFVAAKDGLGAAELYAAVDALDGRIHGETQNRLYASLRGFLRQGTRWFVQNARSGQPLGETVERFAAARTELKPRLLDLSSEESRAAFERRRDALTAEGVPEGLAGDMALLPLVALVPDIAAIARDTVMPLDQVMACYFAVTRLLRIGRLEAALGAVTPADYYENLALERAGTQIAGARRQLTRDALTGFGGESDPAAAWAESRVTAVERVGGQLESLVASGETSVARLTVAGGLLADLTG